MTYNYGRNVPQQMAPQTNRPYQKVMYQQPQYYYQNAPQQQIYQQNAQPMMYQQPQQYSMMQYMQPNGQPAQPVYLPEDVYAQHMQMQMQPIQQPQQQMRYVQPQAPVPVETPQQQAVRDPRRNKKDIPPTPHVAQPALIPQQAYSPAKKPIPVTTPQQYPAPQPVPQQSPQPIPPAAEPLQSLENCLPKVPTSILSKEFTSPPGCFNIIRRGNIPGLAFSQIY